MRPFLETLINWISKFFRKYFHGENRNLPYYITLIVAAIFFSLALNAFIEITDELAENELDAFDESVTNFVISFRSEPLTRFFGFMTDVGDRYAYLTIGIALAAFFYLKHRSWKFIFQTILVLMLSTLSNIVLKEVIQRERPVVEHLVSVDTLSYPSGHSMSAMAFYGFIIYLVTQMKMTRQLRVSLITVLTLIILSVGISRIYLGVHFPSDVAAGFMGGLIWVTFCVIMFNVVSLFRKRNQRPGDGSPNVN